MMFRNLNPYSVLSVIRNVDSDSLLRNHRGRKASLHVGKCDVEFYESFVVVIGNRKIVVLYFNNEAPFINSHYFKQFRLLKITYKKLFPDEIELAVKTSTKDWEFVNDELAFEKLSKKDKESFHYIKL